MQFTRTHFYLAVTVLIAGVGIYAASLGAINFMNEGNQPQSKIVAAQEQSAPAPVLAPSSAPKGSPMNHFNERMGDVEGMGYEDFAPAPGTQTAFIAKTRSMGKNACAEPFKRITVPAVPAKDGQKAIPATSKCVLEQDVVLDETAEVSSFTTVDCQGHKLTPSAVGSGSGNTLVRSVPEAAFVLNDVYGATLKNCDLSGFDFGVFVAGGKVTEEMAANEAVLDYNANKISKNIIAARIQGITMISADNNRIEENTVTIGHYYGAGMISWSDSDLNQIRGNTVTGNKVVPLGTVENWFLPTFPGASIPSSLHYTDGDGIILRNSPQDSMVYNFKVGDAFVQIPYSGETAQGNIVEGNTISVIYKGVAVFGANLDTIVRANTILQANYGILANGLRPLDTPLPGTCSEDAGYYCMESSECQTAGKGSCNPGEMINRDFRPTNLLVENNMVTGKIRNNGIEMDMTNDVIVRGNNVAVAATLPPAESGIVLSMSAVETGTVTRNVASGANYGFLLSEMAVESFGAKVSLNDFKGAINSAMANGGYEFTSELSVDGKGNYYGRACGNTNKVILPVSRVRRGLTFADATHGWAVGKSGEILATIDGGANWTQQRMGAGVLWDISAVKAADGSYRAWAVGTAGAMLKTVDGGATWETIGASAMPAQLNDNVGAFNLAAIVLRGVSFVDENTGWTTGWRNGPSYGMDEMILKTTDGGAHWTQQDLGNFGTHHAMFYDISFSDSMHGYIAGASAGYKGAKGSATWKAYNTNSVFSTSNGGATWTRTNNNDEWLYLNQFVDCIKDNNDKEICYAGNYPGIHMSTDGGVTWTASFIEPEDWGVTTVDFLDASTGWAAGWTGSLFRTTTGGGYGSCIDTDAGKRCDLDRTRSCTNEVWDNSCGGNWVEMPSPVTRYEGSIAKISVLSADSVVAIDANGVVYRTENAGQSWTNTGDGTIVAPLGTTSTHPMVTDSNRYGVSVANTPDASLPATCPLN